MNKTITINNGEIIFPSTSSTTTSLTKEEINNLINAKLLENEQFILLSLAITFTLAFSLFGLYNVLQYFDKKKIKMLVSDTVEDEINKLEKQNKMKNIKIIKQLINYHRQDIDNNEYQRNLIFYDLTSLLATSISVNNNETTLGIKFNTYSSNLFIINQLTSGVEDQIKKALRKLEVDSYKTLLLLPSIQKYIYSLDEKYEYNLIEELDRIKKHIGPINKIA